MCAEAGGGAGAARERTWTRTLLDVFAGWICVNHLDDVVDLDLATHLYEYGMSDACVNHFVVTDGVN